MNIAVIGLGEVGRAYAEGLHMAGYSVLTCEAQPSPAALALADKTGLTIEPAIGNWLDRVDWVLSCVTGSVALAVAKAALEWMQPGQHLADMTTASPDAKRSAAMLSAAKGVSYVDVAIMGSIAMMGLKTPLLAAGTQADAFRRMIDHAGGRATCVDGGAAGDAIALKIMRSIYTKGLEALAVELLVYAEAMGARARLFDQLTDLDEMPLKTLLEGLVRTHVIHARRRAHEVRDAAAEMAAHGLPSLVLPGVAERFDATVALTTGVPLAAENVTIADALAILRSEKSRVA